MVNEGAGEDEDEDDEKQGGSGKPVLDSFQFDQTGPYEPLVLSSPGVTPVIQVIVSSTCLLLLITSLFLANVNMVLIFRIRDGIRILNTERPIIASTKISNFKSKKVKVCHHVTSTRESKCNAALFQITKAINHIIESAINFVLTRKCGFIVHLERELKCVVPNEEKMCMSVKNMVVSFQFFLK